MLDRVEGNNFGSLRSTCFCVGPQWLEGYVHSIVPSVDLLFFHLRGRRVCLLTVLIASFGVDVVFVPTSTWFGDNE